MRLILDLTLHQLQWDPVPPSFNLGVNPYSHQRTDFELAPEGTLPESTGTISPWGTRKYKNSIYIELYQQIQEWLNQFVKEVLAQIQLVRSTNRKR